MHIQDGLTTVCRVCKLLSDRGVVPGQRICHNQFVFKIPRAEREAAARADRGAYPPRTRCAVCYADWEQHMGYLCPSGDSIFVPFVNFDPKVM
jgi:hypothetical protein